MLGKKRLGKKMETRLKREERDMRVGFWGVLTAETEASGPCSVLVGHGIDTLEDNLGVQFMILTGDNQLLRCSHRETEGWIYPSLGFCQEILWVENMADENRRNFARK